MCRRWRKQRHLEKVVFYLVKINILKGSLLLQRSTSTLDRRRDALLFSLKIQYKIYKKIIEIQIEFAYKNCGHFAADFD